MAEETTRRRGILRWFVEHNCLYLISVFCLLLGVWSVMNSATAATSLGSELALLGVFTTYEFLLLAVAWLVYRRFRKGHDGLMLACIAVLLLFDPTFFNNVFYARGLSVGLAVNGVCFLCALGKIAMLFRGIGFPLPRRSALMIAMGAAVVFLIPALFVDRAGATQRLTLSWLWWLLPLLVLAGPRPQRKGVDRHRIPTDDDAARKFPIFIFALPVTAFFVHMGQISRVYGIDVADFTWAPVIMAFLVVAVRCHRQFFFEQRWIVHSALLSAVLLSGEAASFFELHPMGLSFTPWRASLLVGAALAWFLWNAWGSRDLAVAAVIQGVLFVAGPSPDSFVQGLARGDATMSLVALAFMVWLCRRWPHPLLLSVCTGGALAALGRHFGLSDDAAVFLGLQASGLAALVLVERRDGELTDAWRIMPALVYLSAQVFAMEGRGTLASTAFGCAVVEGVLFLGLSAVRRDGAYGIPVVMGTAPYWGEKVFATMRNHFGLVSLALAFGTLFGGLVLSARKDEVLESLNDPAETLVPEEGIS